jgi:RNA polymerase sigma-70 factor (ECF subfamily)
MSAENEYLHLLADVQAGDRAGMGRLAALVWERLHPFVFRTTLNHDLTEDVLQETLLSLLGGIASLRDPERFWPWMYRIAWSKIQDRHRQRRLESVVEGRLRRDASRDSTADSVLDAKVRAEMLTQVSNAVANLSREHQDVVRLRYYDQLRYDDIASLTRTTPQKVRVQFHRAKKSLRAHLTCCV